MSSIGIYHARNRLSDLVAQVERGATITLTRNGDPVAQIVPYTHDRKRALAAAKRIRSRRFHLAGLKFKELIDEGRR